MVPHEKMRPTTGDQPDDKPIPGLAGALLDWLAQVPATREPPNANPAERARAVARAAARKAALVSGTLSLPAGPAGWITILPDLMAVWKIQAQMVADIAGAFGQQASLTREQMLYCLFRHAAAQAVRDLVARVGERVLIRRASRRTLETAVGKVGVRVTQRLIGRGISRWVPIVGALGVAGYAHYDTRRVADTAIELFAHDIAIEGDSDRLGAPAIATPA